MKRYDSYKDSGVEWIGEIPSHWENKKVKHLTDVSVGLVINPSSYYDDNGTIPIINGTNITPKGLDLNKVDYITVESNELLKKTQIYEGDVITMRVGYPGRTCVVSKSEDGINCCSNIISRKSDKLSSYYLSYLINSPVGDTQVQREKIGMGNQSVGIGSFKEFIIPYPPLSEQQQIVSFLDSKTSQIDERIQKKERKIKLLKEYRISLINQVLTKGLNPNVEMKDSGVEWIGEIPSHWRFVKLKQLFKINKRISGELGYDVLSVTQKGLKVKDLENNEGQHSMDYSKYQFVFEGDFVMNHMDLLTGFVDVSKGTGVTSPDYRVFTQIKPELNQQYFLSLFQLCYWRRVFYGMGRGVSNLGRWRLPSSEFLNMYIPYPTESEQEQIVSYLDEQTQKIDSSIQSEEKKIELLKEYRLSLISEVVTGKIDVRLN